MKTEQNFYNSAVFQFFISKGRGKDDKESIETFKQAMLENPKLTVYCLLYLLKESKGFGTIKFRKYLRFLCEKPEYHEYAKQVIPYFPYFGKHWDDIIAACIFTPLENFALSCVGKQLQRDYYSDDPSICAKQCPTHGSWNEIDRIMAGHLSKVMNLSTEDYEKMINRIRVKLGAAPPTKEIKDNKLRPYDIIYECLNNEYEADNKYFRELLQAKWNSLPTCSDANHILCVIDSSDSMYLHKNKVYPLDIAVAACLYIADNQSNNNYFKNKYYLLNTDKNSLRQAVAAKDIYERAWSMTIEDSSFCGNIQAIYDNLLQEIKLRNLKFKDIPWTLLVITDDDMKTMGKWNPQSAPNHMREIVRKWAKYDVCPPRLTYWDVTRPEKNIVELSSSVRLVNGFTPELFDAVLHGTNGYDYMESVLTTDEFRKVLKKDEK